MPALNIESQDDIPVSDECASFAGGMVSNSRANLLAPNQAAYLENMDADAAGKLITRRGIKQIGDNLGEPILGVAYFQRPTSAELLLVVATLSGGLIRSFDGTSWALPGGLYNYISNVPATFVPGNEGTNGYVLYIAQSDSVLRYYLNNNVHSYTSAGVSEVTRVQNGIGFAPSVPATALQSKYFVISDEGGTVCCWFNLDASGADPAAGVRSLEIPILNTYSYTDIIGAIVTYVDADSKFTARIDEDPTTGASTALITCVAPGGRADGTPGNSGLLVRVVTPGGDATNQPPENMSLLCWHTDRLIGSGVSTDPDTVWFSQFLDGSVWDRTNWSIRVGGGDGEPITALQPWINYNLVVFKQHSIWIVDCNPTNDVTEFTIQRVHERIGCTAHKTVCQVGQDVFFLSDQHEVRTVKSILASEQQKEVGPALSYPVADILDRINHAAIGTSCAYHWQNRYILWIPVDGATQPNLGLVYNTINESWSGVWTGWLPTYFSQRKDSGVPKLFFGRSDGSVADWQDYVPESQETSAAFEDMGEDVTCKIITRAMTFGEAINPKTGYFAELDHDESTADAIVQVIKDGSSPEAFERYPTLQNSLYLPLTLPFILPKAGIVRRSFDIQRYEQFREIQFQLQTSRDKLVLRSIRAEAFVDTVVLQN